MPKHEDKICPRCARKFECKVGSISICQCNAVKLSEIESAYIHEQYIDCLCADCMKALRIDYHNNKLKNKIKKLMGLFSGK